MQSEAFLPDFLRKMNLSISILYRAKSQTVIRAVKFNAVLKLQSIAVLTTIVLLSLASRPSFAQQEVFPFLAEIIEDNVNVRAGQNKNFERLCQLNKGEEVIVVGKNYSWYKIKLPSRAQSFIHSEFVRLIDERHGEIIGNRVNIRAADGINHSVLGQLVKGDFVHILETKADWYKIVPIEESFGWINDGLIVFKSKNIPDQQAQQIVHQQEKDSIKDLPLKESVVQEIIVKEIYTVSVEGDLNEDSVYAQDDVYYRFVANDQKIYYLKGFKQALDQFHGFKLRVEGSIDPALQGQHVYPTIIVSKVSLIL